MIELAFNEINSKEDQILLQYYNSGEFFEKLPGVQTEITVYDKAMIKCYVNALRVNSLLTDGVKLKVLQNAIFSSKSCVDVNINTDSDKEDFSNIPEDASPNIDIGSNAAAKDNIDENGEDNIGEGTTRINSDDVSKSIPVTSTTNMITQSNDADNMEQVNVESKLPKIFDFNHNNISSFTGVPSFNSN
ncbi:hypothetical protein HZS_4242 [Henneguya salminicola]|nr:hypothetical protein HZS_4242 [Henneguya salminicola]